MQRQPRLTVTVSPFDGKPPYGEDRMYWLCCIFVIGFVQGVQGQNCFMGQILRKVLFSLDVPGELEDVFEVFIVPSPESATQR